MTTVDGVADIAKRCSEVLDEIERAVLGKRNVLELVLMALLCDGHVLIEDFPGLAKNPDGTQLRRGH